MPSRSDLRILLIVLGFGLAGCASNPAPYRWLPPAGMSGSDPYGAWVEIDYAPAPVEFTRWGSPRTAKSPTRLKGELVAVEAESVWVCREPDSAIVAVPKTHVIRIKAASFAGNYSEITGWSILGGISTIPNGVFLIFTLPAWIIGGNIASSSYAHEASVRFDARKLQGPQSWQQLSAYARFPQGLPDDVDPRGLAHKTPSPSFLRRKS